MNQLLNAAAANKNEGMVCVPLKFATGEKTLLSTI